jgi:hypothetical protein
MTDLAQHIVEIARLFWGPENRALSSRTELRWGKKAPARSISTQDSGSTIPSVSAAALST